MDAQTTRLRVIAENLANQDTTGSTPGADPYRARQSPSRTHSTRQLGLADGRSEAVGHDAGDLPLRYDPSNPAANATAM